MALCGPHGDPTARIDRGPILYRFDQTRKEVLLRDNFTCCLSGTIDHGVVPDAREKGCDAPVRALIPVRIFDAVDETESLSTTAELFRRIYECSPVFADKAQANVPQNTCLVHPDVHFAFTGLFGCLAPTEAQPTLIPRVDVNADDLAAEFKDHTLADEASRYSPYTQLLEDVQPDGSISGVPLPDATLLRARAAMTIILHESGVIDGLDRLRYLDWDEVPGPGAEGDSFMQHIRRMGYNGTWI
ncbi:hypothetical protein L227DRAFT_610824 [Lentinus tigrinus ALCF2SS1-6]|uniref:HNH nuclease domain-containing protein n=1 Tax=Lentinus tigrinus ALCF2SS1-6 TaxID=1328759 RepID=A0A5C2SBR0_9APHY|nr:hypothetical protein L227DRAFT_610824 [Lentinus tigrinus ALCF2SS1-6]